MGEVNTWDPTDASNTDLWPEGMVGGTINNSGRAMQGAVARWFADTNGSIAAGGSSNAFTVTSNRTISALANNIVMAFTANHSITGAATLNLNGLGAKSLVRFNGDALVQGDIISGQPVVAIYKSADDVWFVMSALAASTGNMFADFDENASPGDPAANVARLYARDDGGGATELIWRDSGGVASVLRTATQAEMEAGSSVTRNVPVGRQHFHPGHPKAGGNFDGTGTPAFRSGDYGMGAITDNAAGDYTLNLDTAFADTNYWLAGFCRSTLAGRAGVLFADPSASKTTSAMRVRTGREPETAIDPTEVGVTFWGDYA